MMMVVPGCVLCGERRGKDETTGYKYIEKGTLNVLRE
jgi:hypothetical protein